MLDTASHKIPCKHWESCGLTDGGCCKISAYTNPSNGICLNICNQYDGPDRGLGDTVGRVIQTITAGKVKPCNACKKRQQKLNQLLPFHGE